MGNIDGMRAVLGLFLVSPVVETAPRHGADVHGAAATALPAIVCHLSPNRDALWGQGPVRRADQSDVR